jgi:hypothetical protein
MPTPTVAETFRAKRLLSDLPVTGGASEAAKRRRCVRFDDEHHLEGEEKDGNWTEAEAKTSRSSSPFAGCDMRLCEELYTSSSSDPEDEIEDEQHIEEREATNSGLGNHPWMRIDYEASESASSSDPIVVPMMPLITPPSSPRTIRALSVDGETMELTTICEWPSNLTVDNAITAALELVPYHHDALETRRMSSVGP